jgi:hypothetical protein
MPSRVRVRAATTHSHPFSYQVDLPNPTSPELEVLRSRLLEPGLTALQQTLLIEQFRVAEAIHAKEHARAIDLRRAIAALCELQAEFLNSLDPGHLRNVSLGALALGIGLSPLELGNALFGFYIRAAGKDVSVDSLIGPVGLPEVAIGFIEPRFLIPTDEPRREVFSDNLLSIFRAGRQSILDPVLAVEDDLRPGFGLVCDGNHRAAAAFKCRTKVRVAILKNELELRFILRGAVAQFARHLRMRDFVNKCREQSESIGLYRGGWPEYLAQIEN